jgi:hypothetical protein
MVLGMVDSFQLEMCFSPWSNGARPDRHRRERNFLQAAEWIDNTKEKSLKSVLNFWFPEEEPGSNQA